MLIISNPLLTRRFSWSENIICLSYMQLFSGADCKWALLIFSWTLFRLRVIYRTSLMFVVLCFSSSLLVSCIEWETEIICLSAAFMFYGSWEWTSEIWPAEFKRVQHYLDLHQNDEKGEMRRLKYDDDFTLFHYLFIYRPPTLTNKQRFCG